MSSDFFKTPIEYLKGVGPQRSELLKKEAGIFTFGHLIEYFPFRYIDRSKFYKVSQVDAELPYIQLRGRISGIQLFGNRRTTRMTALFSDDTGSIELVWFNGFRWLKNAFKPGLKYIVFGKPNLFGNKFSIAHPEVEPVSEDNIRQSSVMQPVYNSSEKLKSYGLDSKGISKLIGTLLPLAKNHIKETLPESLLNEIKLPSRCESLINVHFPDNEVSLKRARARLKFEELFYLQLNLLRNKINRSEKSRGPVFKIIGEKFNRFYNERLLFELTSAQKRVLKEIRSDTLTGRQMNRLLQGDVGSGKTVVAVMSMLMALDNGFQAGLMAPTEVLAFQHFESVSSLLQPLGIKVGLLTGSTKTAIRRTLLKELKEGDIQILIGTHALIEDVVQFERLGMVIIDEQHRFGVAQRARLWAKAHLPPHVLVMTATPIPRTLAMTLYGDLDVSVIDEMPPGRKPIKTIHQYDAHRLKVFGFIRQQIKEGRQVYIVYPLINESETLDLKDLTDGYDSIVREFPSPQYQVSIVHGQMKPADKDMEMQRFVNGDTHIMVATTVIEVGIDVPNASLMVIESAERFGLSQLHQLRGRVGRGAEQSFCILMTGMKLSAEARKRMEVMVNSSDGFEIAEVDLRLRGPGDIQGTRQSGIPELKMADLSRDEKILKYARQKAKDYLEEDPHLEKPQSRIISQRLRHLFPHAEIWSRVG